MFRSRCHRPQEKLNSIECNISTNQISFLLLSSCSSESNVNPTLFTFPTNVEKDFVKLAAQHLSIPTVDTDPHNPHFEFSGKIVDENQTFSSYSLNDLILIINENISLKFHRFPNESLDLLFDTFQGQTTYLTRYLKSHFGDKHEFTIYPIQKEKKTTSTADNKQWNE